jgi:alcohol dehydrogenase (cytochrome c)
MSGRLAQQVDLCSDWMESVKSSDSQCSIARRGSLIALYLGWASSIPAAETVSAKSEGGGTAYTTHCAACHGANLEGGFGPPLNSDAFIKKWVRLPKSALSRHISTNMPPAAPGSLDSVTYAAVIDFVDVQSGLAGARDRVAKTQQDNEATSEDKASGPAHQDAIYLATRQRLNALIQAIRPVTEEQLRNPSGHDWLAWAGGRSSQSFSPLEQIHRGNAQHLTLAWSLALRPGTNAIAPLVHDGIMFVNHSGTVQALDASNGEVIWSYERPAAIRRQPISQPRGIALYDEAVYVPTIDNHVLALEAKTGRLLWDHEIAKAESALQITSAPIVARGKVLQGMSGCFGSVHPGGCFIVALDAKTGNELWRFATIAKPGEPNGDSWNGAPMDERFGASVWSAGSYDPDLNLAYFGTSQTYHVAPLLKAGTRRHQSTDALYTDTTLALNPDTGKLVWYYQHLPGDIWNMDWAFERTLIDLPRPSGALKAILTVGKLGIVEALDAKTGKYLWSVDLGLQNLITAIDPKTGTKSINPDAVLATDQPKVVCPSVFGARAWPTLAYDPQTGRLYLPLAESCMKLSYAASTGDIVHGDLLPPLNHDGNFGQVVALDVQSRSVTWRVRRRMLPASAALATASGLLFEGTRDGRFRASDSSTGATLWEAQLNATPSSFPLSFMVNGRQHIAVVTGGGNVWDAGMRRLTPELPAAQVGTTLWVFALPTRM